EPANIPIAKKSNNVGTPNLYDVLPTIMLTKSNKEPTNSMFSIVKFILFYLLFQSAQSYFFCSVKLSNCLVDFCLVEPKIVRLHEVFLRSVSIAANVSQLKT